ncbi:MAG: dephospho-CoA kinase [Paludibacter sp.]
MKKPLIIGITGGIGSGKTTLSDHLRREGYSVYDSDKEARRLQNEHPVIRQKLTDLFGSEIYTFEGLNRRVLADIVFGNQELLLKLNNIVHPVIREDFRKWIDKCVNEQFVFVESAILFESGFIKLVDKVVLMTASEELRMHRVMKRDGSTPEQVKARMSNQLDDKDKIPFADYVIHTDDNLPMIDKMKRLLKQLSLI